MNKKEILKMTKEAHLDVYGLGKDHKQFMSAVKCLAYSAFAAGVLSEREACAKICDKEANDKHESNPWNGCASYLANNI